MSLHLLKYNEENKSETIERITLFFGFHSSLLNGEKGISETDRQSAEQTLSDWLMPPNELYTIYLDAQSVGFIRISYRGANVAWIEDIYVDPQYRNRGIATQAIFLAEDLIKTNPDYTSVCLDVVPRNEAALRLYHKLGYDSLSLITVRKELYGNKRDLITNLFDLEFKY